MIGLDNRRKATTGREEKEEKGEEKGMGDRKKGREREGKLITELILLWDSVPKVQERSNELSRVFLYVPALSRLRRGTTPRLWMLCLPLCKD